MAKRLNLQAYQQDILSRLKALEQSEGAATTSRLGVQIGDDPWLLSLSDVGEVLPVPDIQTVPLTRPWFMGMTNIRGNLYAVNDLSLLMGGRQARLGSESRILLAGARFGINSALLVDRLYGLRSLAEMHASEATGDKWCKQEYLDASAMRWRELDVSALLNSAAFMQVAV